MLLTVPLAAVVSAASCRTGEMAGGEQYRMDRTTVDDASAWCRKHSSCAGFTAKYPGASCSSIGAAVINASFRDAWGARRINSDPEWSSWVVPGPRPPPPSPPLPPNPCTPEGNALPKFHFTNLGIGPHDVNAIFKWKGVYHIMHQANWTDWAHLVSDNLVKWSRLPSALSPNGDWDGSLTLLDGNPVILYDCFNDADCRPPPPPTTKTGEGSRVGDPPIVGVARPVNLTDPNLTLWKKDPHNPIAVNGAHGAYAGPSTLWRDAVHSSQVNMLMPVGAHIARLTSTDPTLHAWDVADAIFDPSSRPSGPAEFLPLSSSNPYVTHVLAGVAPPSPYRGGNPWYVLGRYNHTSQKFSNASAPMPFDVSPVVIFSQLGQWDGRLLFTGWFNIESSCLTVLREITYDPGLNLLRSNPIIELEQLRGTPLSLVSAPVRILPSDIPLNLVGTSNGTAAARSLDLEFTVELSQNTGSIFSVGIFADSPDLNSAAVLLRVNVTNSQPQRFLSVVTMIPKGAGRSPTISTSQTTSFPISATNISVRILADRFIVESFVGGGLAVASTPASVTVGGTAAYLSAFDTPLVLSEAKSWAMGCIWQHYP